MTTKKLFYQSKGLAIGTIAGMIEEEIIAILDNDRLNGKKLYKERYKDSIESITSKIVDEEWIDG